MGRHSGGPPDDPSDDEPAWGPSDSGPDVGGYERRSQGHRRSDPRDVPHRSFEEPQRGYGRRPYDEPDPRGFQQSDEYSDPRYADDRPDPRYAASDYPEDDEDDEYPAPAGGEPRYDDEYWQTELGPGYDDEVDSPTNVFAVTPPAPPKPPTGPQHGGDWDGGEWTGSHRAVGAGRRGVSLTVVGALITVVVVVGAIILWRFFGDALSSRSEAAAARCVDGGVDVAVVVDSAIVEQISTLADHYNQTAAPVGDRCVKVGIKAAESDAVVNGLSGTWPADLGEQPALWIPGSSVSEARLEAAAGNQTISDSRSLVTSPVVLAVRPQLKNALAQQNWSTLPALQTNPTALDGLNLTGWGSLRMALPLTGDSDATYLAAEAIAAAAVPAGTPASVGAPAIRTAMQGQPKLADTSLDTAMDALLQGTDLASAPVHAVVTTEQQLYQRGASLTEAKNKLASWLPPGATAMADFPTVLLAGKWLSSEQVSAASEFARYLAKPSQLAELAKAGFRTDGGKSPTSEVTDFGALPATVSVGDNGTRATLASSVSAPTQSPVVTIMLDQSMDVVEGGKSRLANVTAALNARLQALPPGADIGLWTFDGVAGRTEVPTGLMSDPIGGQPRSAVLQSNLNGQVATTGGAVSYTTLKPLYAEAMANFRDGQPNSVLVITSGPHTDQSLDDAGLQAVIRQNFQAAKPVAVNVIDFGADPDRSTWEAVAQISGGTYQNVANSTSPDLAAALSDMIG
jgi:Bacterial extracellular solute-binding protein